MFGSSGKKKIENKTFALSRTCFGLFLAVSMNTGSDWFPTQPSLSINSRDSSRLETSIGRVRVKLAGDEPTESSALLMVCLHRFFVE
jgi:hypothetical protein